MGRREERASLSFRSPKTDLREQQQHQIPHQTKRITNSVPHSHHNYKNAPASSTPNSVRRSTRRNPNPDPESPDAEEEDEDDDEDDDEEEELTGKRREKKLKLNSYASDSNAEEDNAGSVGNKKRKSMRSEMDLGSLTQRRVSSPFWNEAIKHRFKLLVYGVFAGTKLDLGPSTPLPDKKLLLFILERLQKCEGHLWCYSEPADPEELPDYHEVIEHPMDFGTVKKKLTGGAYTYPGGVRVLSWKCQKEPSFRGPGWFKGTNFVIVYVYEQRRDFDKDRYLICTNAMQYNAPDTVIFDRHVLYMSWRKEF
ncbi:hypothetical protein F8388_007884 [Cannabis sativa]|uniref:Bromo domain-containing protein n=1 Tax=Cannabis sativa TaxID=3483 RepID=A0A7J6FTM4_CANSA|nr:hypothetical protein F8388_007884 [Cannabis sativa]